MRKLLVILSVVGALGTIGIPYYLDARIPRATATTQIHPPEWVSDPGTIHTGPG
jgi:hypothetical protein